MSAMLHDRPVLTGSVGGGAAGRRVVTRWAWRLLRREWRQQLLVLLLLALTVAAAAFGVAAAYNVASRPSPQFGSASYLLQFAGPQKTMTADITAARKAFGTVQVIGHQAVSIPGSAQTVEFRALNPDGPYSGPMLALMQGHYPAGAGQVAVTAGVAQTLQGSAGPALSAPSRSPEPQARPARSARTCCDRPGSSYGSRAHRSPRGARSCRSRAARISLRWNWFRAGLHYAAPTAHWPSAHYDPATVLTARHHLERTALLPLSVAASELRHIVNSCDVFRCGLRQRWSAGRGT